MNDMTNDDESLLTLHCSKAENQPLDEFSAQLATSRVQVVLAAKRALNARRDDFCWREEHGRVLMVTAERGEPMPRGEIQKSFWNAMGIHDSSGGRRRVDYWLNGLVRNGYLRLQLRGYVTTAKGRVAAMSDPYSPRERGLGPGLRRGSEPGHGCVSV